jgi:hypothetical protein
MKAIAHFKCLPIEHPDALVEIDIPEPLPGPRDLLVEVKAVSVNPAAHPRLGRCRRGQVGRQRRDAIQAR